MSRLYMLVASVGICATCSLSYAEEREVIFQDDFNRDDANAVGNEWSSRGSALLKDKAAFFKVKEEEFRPRIERSFPIQNEGKFTVSFKMDWLRESEGTWSFHMQLGHSADLPRFLIYDQDLAKGIGVNLVWGGGELVDFEPAGTFGYSTKGKFYPLFVVNDMEDEKTVVDEAVVTITVDLDSDTFAVGYNGKTYRDLPLSSDAPIDTIRFITNGCSATGFTKSSIDDVLITKGG